jgi:hypothetical protein
MTDFIKDVLGSIAAIILGGVLLGSAFNFSYNSLDYDILFYVGALSIVFGCIVFLITFLRIKNQPENLQ